MQLKTTEDTMKTIRDRQTNGQQDNSVDDSPVSRMFDGRSVFITGASGFIGRVLLEKLLSSYSGIRRIYILMRAKKNQQPYERLHKQLLKVPIFDRIRASENGKELLDKIVVVAGDIAEPRLGISDEDMRMMLDDKSLSIVFHSAATIKFDEPLKVSVTLNLIATKTIIELCRKLPNLISLCHVSTAYVNSDLKDSQWIEEKLYPIKERPDQLIKLAEILDENIMQELKITLVDQRPNTYTYTKALAEHLIVQEASDLPVVIVRPSIVVAAWKEPLRGWIDNLNGPTGLILAIGKGLLRSMQAVGHVKADIIPVDIVVNTMVASAYYAAKINNKLDDGRTVQLVRGISEKSVEEINEDEIDLIRRTNHKPPLPLSQQQPPSSDLSSMSCSTSTSSGCSANGHDNNQKHQQQQQRQEKEPTTTTTTTTITTTTKTPPIIHCNSGEIKPITWGDMELWCMPIIRHYPSCQVLRYPFGTFKSNKYHDLITRLFVHYLPALIIDMLCLMLGKKRQLMSIYYKLHCATAALAHFCTHNYNFKSNNIKLLQSSLTEADRRDLYMDIKPIDWYNFWDGYVLGARRFVLKEEDHTLDEARKSFLRAYYIEICLRVLLVVLVSACCLPLLVRLTATYPIGATLQKLNLCA